MRIGILTHPLDYNYGCLLQAFALQKVLIRMGHEVVTINRYPDIHLSTIQKLRSWGSRFLQKVINKHDVSLAWNLIETREIKEKLCSNTNHFVERNIKNTGIVCPKDLHRIDEEYQFDAYVVGSDQVWLPHFCLNSFLDFVKRDNVIRLFYAASSGRESFANYPELSKRCRTLCEKFSGISVRESSLIQIANQYLGRDAELVLDPTLLLNKEDYLNACVEAENKAPVIFTYILDKNEMKRQVVNKVQDLLQLEVVNGTVQKDYVRGKHMNINDCIYPSVDHWIQNLNRARFVVTDSFHGTCMSIIFNKPFVVIGNKERGYERFNSLLTLLGLKNRLIESYNDVIDSLFNQLPTGIIDEVLHQKREESLNFLNTHLR